MEAEKAVSPWDLWYIRNGPDTLGACSEVLDLSFHVHAALRAKLGSGIRINDDEFPKEGPR